MKRFCALLLLSAAACGHGDLTAAEFPAAFAHALDGPQAFCRKQAAYLEQTAEQEDAHTYSDDLPKAIKAGRAKFDPRAARRCIDGLTSRTCDRIATDVLQSCFAATTGLVAAGGSCSWVFECAEGFCTRGDSGCPATCTRAVQPGGTCPGKQNAQCDGRAGFGCVNSVCVAPLGVGETCSFTSNCQVPFYCSASSLCARRGDALASCEQDEQCSPGLYCRVTSAGGLCNKKVARGQPCGEDADHAISADSECADGLLCSGLIQRKGAPVAGTCVPPGDVGATCNAGADVNGCAAGLNCVSGRCTMPPSSGPCVNGACLRSAAYCDPSGQCQPRKANGAACKDAHECQSSYCPQASGTCDDSPEVSCHEP